MKPTRALTFKIIALWALLVGCSGCGSLVTRTAPEQAFFRNGAFPGVRATPQTVHDCWVDSSSDLAVLFCLDFPLTLAFDTVLLPADLVYAAHGSSH